MSIKILGTIDHLLSNDERVVQLSGDTDGIIASFYDKNNNPSLFLDGTSARLGNVGVKTITPNEALTVNGNVSASGGYYGEGAGNVNGDFQLVAGEFSWYVRGSSGDIEVPTNKGIKGGSYGGNQVMFPVGFGLQLNSLRDGTTYIQTGSAGDINKTWAFSNDGSLTLPASGVLKAANGSDLLIGSNLIPTTSAFYIGDINNPVNGIYLAANTLNLASTTAGISGLSLSNVDNVLTINTGGLRSSVIYTGGLFLSGNNIGADPLVGGLPMTIGTNGLPAVEFLVPIKLKTTTGTPNITGNASFTGNVSAVNFYGDGSHLTNVANPFNQSLNTTNNVTFSSLNLSDGLTAHNTTIVGEVSCTGRIYAADVHAPLSVTDLNTTTKTLALSDVNSIITCSDASDMDIYVPANSAVPFPIGTEIKFIQLGTKKVRINANSGVDLANSSGQFRTKGQHAVTWLFQVTTNQWIFAGDTSA